MVFSKINSILLVGFCLPNDDTLVVSLFSYNVALHDMERLTATFMHLMWTAMIFAADSVSTNPLYVNQEVALSSDHLAAADNTYDTLVKTKSPLTSTGKKAAENNTYDSIIKKRVSG